MNQEPLKMKSRVKDKTKRVLTNKFPISTIAMNPLLSLALASKISRQRLFDFSFEMQCEKVDYEWNRV